MDTWLLYHCESGIPVVLTWAPPSSEMPHRRHLFVGHAHSSTGREIEPATPTYNNIQGGKYYIQYTNPEN